MKPKATTPLMMNYFNIPSTILSGGGASAEAGAQLRRANISRVLLVSDDFMESSGLVDRIESNIIAAGIAVVRFCGVQPDPTDSNVREGLDQLRQNDCDGIVALGGGSPIDCAKAISVAATNNQPLADFMGSHKIPRRGLFLMAIPTTAGTGSEVTKVAVITDTSRSIKMMMLDPHLLPDIALVDYELTLSMPPALTAHVGVDTLTHGIEAYISKKASPLTDPIAESCIRLVSEHLETAFLQPNNHAARAGMMLAATQGGMAFANSSVCLVHGMSRPLGAMFHLPHGLSNAVLLPAVTRFSIYAAPERYATIARIMKFAHGQDDDNSAGEKLIEGLVSLNHALGIPKLRECLPVEEAAFENALPKMAADALASGSPDNNPKVPDAADIMKIYRESW